MCDHEQEGGAGWDSMLTCQSWTAEQSAAPAAQGF